MQAHTQLIVTYWDKTNAFYQAKLVEKNKVSTLSQEEANKLIGASGWTITTDKFISVKSRAMIEKTFVYTAHL